MISVVARLINASILPDPCYHICIAVSYRVARLINASGDQICCSETWPGPRSAQAR